MSDRERLWWPFSPCWLRLRRAGKGISYLGGLTEGAETIALFVAICLWPGAFATLAWGFAGLCALTTLGRWRAGWRDFG